MTYLAIKYVHIISMVLLFGTGLGSAFYKWMADRSGNLQHIAVTNRHVVLADWMFTTPAVFVQPLTGLMMVYILKLPLTTDWILISLILYVIAGLCWLPVVWIQIRMRQLSDAAVANNTPLPLQYRKLARAWFLLGVPAFLAMVAIVLLMVFKSSVLDLL